MDELTRTWSKEDFLESTEPYEELYKLINDKFALERALTQMSELAKLTGVKNFRTLFKGYCQNQKMNRVADYTLNVTNFDGQEMELDTGEWEADEHGITKYGQFGEVIACVHPIMPVQRLVNIDSGVEKLKIAYRKGRNWRYVVSDKKQLASSNSIIGLADYGIAVTSENARHLVTYLHDIENLNYDAIPENNSVSRLGWIDGEGFSPYVDNLIFDGDLSFRHFFESVREKGKYEKWLTLVKKIRQGGIPARILLAASFASALVEPCGGLPFFVHLWGGTETGKPQPLSTRIITPTGETTMDQIKVGDEVIGCDGKPHKVTGVYPKGKLEIYELTFKDGTKSRCSKDHLWSVKTLTRKEHGRGFKVMSLEEMMELPLKKDGYNLRIPIAAPVQYSPGGDLPIGAYLLGCLLGDGCLTLKVNPANGSRNIYFNNSEDDVLQMVGNELAKIGLNLKPSKGMGNQHVLSGPGKAALMDKIKSLGLNVLGEDKFIPTQYKLASIEERRELLAGMFDTDGCVNPCGSYTYSTASKQLADDIASVSRSLGYRATIKCTDRTGQEYTSASKKYYRVSPEYTVRIMTHDIIFKSEKHTQKELVASSKHRKAYTHLYDDLPIISIEPCGVEECQCIMVDSEEHTYLCDDFIVTHNTVGLMLAASVWANPEMGKYIHTFNSTTVAQELAAGFVNSMPLILDELQIVKEKKDFDNMIYQLAEGVGKSRGQKTGGMQKTQTWNNCILTTGEQPISSGSSGGGAVNRIIEINCEDTRLFADPVHTADTLKRNYGFAGKIFVEKLREPNGMEMALELQKTTYLHLVQGETTEKQALAASIILTADTLINKWIFQDGQELYYKDIIQFLSTKKDVSVNDRAFRWLTDWIAQNKSKFDESSFATDTWGKFELGTICIIRNVFDRACHENGFNSASFLAWLKRNDLIETPEKGNTKMKRINGIPCHCVVLTPIGQDFEEA